MRKLINRFQNDELGAALAEYGLLVGLIATVCIVAVTSVGTHLNTVFTNIATSLAGV